MQLSSDFTDLSPQAGLWLHVCVTVAPGVAYPGTDTYRISRCLVYQEQGAAVQASWGCSSSSSILLLPRVETDGQRQCGPGQLWGSKLTLRQVPVGVLNPGGWVL